MEAAEDNLGDSSAQPNSPWALGRLLSNIALILILIMNILNRGGGGGQGGVSHQQLTQHNTSTMVSSLKMAVMKMAKGTVKRHNL